MEQRAVFILQSTTVTMRPLRLTKACQWAFPVGTCSVCVRAHSGKGVEPRRKQETQPTCSHAAYRSLGQMDDCSQGETAMPSGVMVILKEPEVPSGMVAHT